MPVFRTDFHHHCDIDPVDCLDYSAYDLVDRLVEKGIQACAITPHGMVFEDRAVIEYAASKKLLLIPGVEKKVGGYEVVILNVTAAEIPVDFSFNDLAELRKRRGDSILVFAPHPFYPRKSCIGPVLDSCKELIDAVEFAHLYFTFWNPNLKALEWARINNKPVLANSDSHTLVMAGFHSSLVQAEKLEATALFNAIRAGRVTYESRYKTPVEICIFLFKVVLSQLVLRIPRQLKRFATDLFLD